MEERVEAVHVAHERLHLLAALAAGVGEFGRFGLKGRASGLLAQAGAGRDGGGDGAADGRKIGGAGRSEHPLKLGKRAALGLALRDESAVAALAKEGK